MSLDKDQVTRAVNALVKHVKSKGAAAKSGHNELFEDDQIVWLQVGLKNVPDPKKKALKIEIPNAVLPAEAEICLITKDPQAEFKQLVADKGIKDVTKVIGVSKLREKYKAYEQKRQLCDLYDVFMADERVLPMLPRLLGKTFFEKKKQPISVDLKKKDLAAEIKSAKDATYLYLGLGSCCAVKIGHTGHSTAQIVDNVIKGMEQIVGHVPGKWKNIQSVHIKTADSTALPVFNSLPFGGNDSVQSAEPAHETTENAKKAAQPKTPKSAATPSKASKKAAANEDKPATAKKAPKAASEEVVTPAANGKTPKAKLAPAKAASTPAAGGKTPKTTAASGKTPGKASQKTPARTPGTAAKRAAPGTGDGKSAKKQRTAKA